MLTAIYGDNTLKHLTIYDQVKRFQELIVSVDDDPRDSESEISFWYRSQKQGTAENHKQ